MSKQTMLDGRLTGARRRQRAVFVALVLALFLPLVVLTAPAQAQNPESTLDLNVQVTYLGPQVVLSGSVSSSDGVPDVTVQVEDLQAGGSTVFDGPVGTALRPPLGLPAASWRVPLTLADSTYRVTATSTDGGITHDVATADFTVVSTPILPLEVISSDAQWAYYDIGNAPAAQPPSVVGDPDLNWFDDGFDVAAWEIGAGEIGYGDSDEDTVSREFDAGGQKVVAQYFRHEFTPEDLSSYDGLTLSVLRDDGAVVYLNGAELGRSNMPTGALSYESFALTASEQTIAISLSPGQLLDGQNVLAIEVHQRSAASSDLSFAASLVATTSDGPRVSNNTEGTFVLTAGDMARCNFDGDEAVAAQMAELFDTDSGLFIGLGDLAYNNGTIDEFTNCYDPTIGQFRDVTWPAPGNHEHGSSPNAAGYREYFGAAAGPFAGPTGGLWYGFDIDENWHAIGLDSDCRGREVLPGAIGGDGCAVGSEQELWLRGELEANKDKNILAFFHHPPFTNNQYTDHEFTFPLWRALAEYGAEITLHGHEHHYERYVPLDYWGDDASVSGFPGVSEFIIGSGGTFPRYDIRPQQPESAFKGTFPNGTNDFGVLQLWLRADGYEWKWESIYGLADGDSGVAGLTPPMDRANISGLVRDQSDQSPLAGIEVCAAATRSDAELCMVTDVDGSYDLGPLVSDSYRLVTSDTANDYAAQNAVDSVLLAAPAAASYDIDMIERPSIAGQVTSLASGGPIANATVCARNVQDAGANPVCANSNGNGDYLIRRLDPNRDHVVSFASTGFISECYDDRRGVCGGAATVVELATTDVTGIDAALETSPGGIEGTVTASSSGAPLAGITVCADSARLDNPACETTDANGDFSIGDLLTSNYVVTYEDPAGNYVGECYRDRSCDAPLLIGVIQPSVRSDIDAQLDAIVPPTPTPTPTATATPVPNATPTPTPTPTMTPVPGPTPTPTVSAIVPGSITGQITVLATGSPVFAARVCAKRGLPAGEFCVISGLDGRYAITGLASGNYTVSATDPVRRYLTNCAGTRPCDTPFLYGVSSVQGVIDADIALDPFFTAANPTPTPIPFVSREGTIEGRVSRGGVAPAAGIEVCSIATRDAAELCVMSAADGSYVISGLRTGNYRIEFDGGAVCYRSWTGCLGYTPVGVASPGGRTAIDANLPM